MINMFTGKKIAISGGTGSWGQELTRQLLKQNPSEIIIYSRGEGSQVEMERAFCDSRITFVIGDIRDRGALFEAMRSVDYVFHAAALKHVPICENQIQEALKTNIDGTINMIDCAIKHKVKKFIDISTDKVVDAANLYGMTKAVAEKLTIQANCKTKDTDFIVARTGNVLGSTGSVVPYMIDQIRVNNKIKVTTRDMVRFFLTLEQAIELLFYAIKKGKGGEVFVRDIPAFYILDLAEILVERYGNKETEIELCGMREGEKIGEALISEHEVSRTYKHGEYYVIYPMLKTGREYGGKLKVETKGLISDDRISTKEHLKQLLKDGGLI